MGDDNKEEELVRHDERIKTLADKLHSMELRFTEYVLKVEFMITRNLVYGLVALLLTAVITAIVTTVLRK